MGSQCVPVTITWLFMIIALTGKHDQHATEGEFDLTGSDSARDPGSNRRNTDRHAFLLCEDFRLRQGDCHETKP